MKANLDRLARLAPIVLTTPSNTRWATGFDGATLVYVSGEGRCVVVTSVLDYERAIDQVGHMCDVVAYAKYRIGVDIPAIYGAEELARRLGIGGKLRVDSTNNQLVRALASSTGAELVDASSDVARLRMVKTVEELRLMRSAAEIALRVHSELELRGRERDVAAAAIAKMIELGAEAPSFDPIVASGPNSAYPHHRTGDRELRSGDVVVVDLGARFGGYCSDYTRTHILGSADTRIRDIYAAVEEALHRR